MSGHRRSPLAVASGGFAHWGQRDRPAWGCIGSVSKVRRDAPYLGCRREAISGRATPDEQCAHRDVVARWEPSPSRGEFRVAFVDAEGFYGIEPVFSDVRQRRKKKRCGAPLGRYRPTRERGQIPPRPSVCSRANGVSEN